MLALHIKMLDLPEPVREYCFHPRRKWRADFAFIDQRILVEVDGGTFSGGRHVRGKGYEEDCRKINEATRLGWLVFRFTTEMVKSGEAIALLETILKPGDEYDQV